MRKSIILILFIHLLFLSACKTSTENEAWQWQTISAQGAPLARHEAGLIAFNKQIYLMGGRGLKKNNVYDIASNQWQDKSQPPIEIHHFQPVVYKNRIYIIGAMTGPWPNEKPLQQVMVYDPVSDTYEYSHPIPEERQRGGAGAVVYKDKIYLIGGITNGHIDGNVAWFDEYDPNTGEWRVLENAPNRRDHFHATTLGNKLYAFAGRLTRQDAEPFGLTNKYGNVYDFTTKQWQPVTSSLTLPTTRAGNAVFSWLDNIVIVGGESNSQMEAHKEVEAYNSNYKTWARWPSLNTGRHGTGAVVVDGVAYIASGSGNRGGGPELTSIERLPLPKSERVSTNLNAIKEQLVNKQFHPLTLSFQGPDTDENAELNPFLNYKLIVEFTHIKSNQIFSIPGYYAADGNAAETSATNGNIWRVKFSPQLKGDWQYTARMYKGERAAIDYLDKTFPQFPLQNPSGSFLVTASDKQSPDFRATGKLSANNGYFIFDSNQNYWLKAGTNSPENLLGFKDFDGTYRVSAQNREGEAAASSSLHQFPTHLTDWKLGDPSWQSGKGKALIGAINYLADQGMNASYFLTMNINGDGQDVWPYTDHNSFTRFDVSKLEQWDIVFNHMQSLGVLLHLVIQETENEKLLDAGDTKDMRKLYFNELIARFGYHNALIWNLGEENGPAKWSPNAQNHDQREQMISYLTAADPYNHPILLHTHAYDPTRSDILAPLLGNPNLDGLSLQQDKREAVPEVITHWSTLSEQHGNKWLITMDEIGMWHTGAKTDDEDPNHDSLRRHALWGAILSGSAGVEWYFGAKSPHNDLTSEDWRKRGNLWSQTRVAHQFFTQNVEFWQLKSCSDIVSSQQLCGQVNLDTYVIYNINGEASAINMENVEGIFDVKWFEPKKGKKLNTGTVEAVKASVSVDLGSPPYNTESDWVVLLTRK